MNGKSGNGRVDGLNPVARQSNICPAQNQEEIVVACVGLAGRGKETPYALGFRHDTNCADRRQPGRDARNWRLLRQRQHLRSYDQNREEAAGRVCRDTGGIFDPNQSCSNPMPGYINFATLSGHYVSPLVINNEDGVDRTASSTDIRARTYRGTVPVVLRSTGSGSSPITSRGW